jgi:chromosome segregation protein
VQTEGKLKPWLAGHGLRPAGLWTKVHIEPGWKPRWGGTARAPVALGSAASDRARQRCATGTGLLHATLAIVNTHKTPLPLSEMLRLNGEQGLSPGSTTGSKASTAGRRRSPGRRGKLTWRGHHDQ